MGLGLQFGDAPTWFSIRQASLFPVPQSGSVRRGMLGADATAAGSVLTGAGNQSPGIPDARSHFRPLKGPACVRYYDLAPNRLKWTFFGFKHLQHFAAVLISQQ